MAHLSSSLSQDSREGAQFLRLGIALLFFVTFWAVAGAVLSLNPENVANESRNVYRSLENRAEGNASLIDQLIWACLGLFGFYLHVINKDRAVYVWKRAWPLAVVLVVILASVTWSSVPDIALRRAVKHLLFITAIAGVAISVNSPRELLRMALLFTGFIMVLNIATVVVFPFAGTNANGDFLGLHGHKNTAGLFAVITVLVWFTAARWFKGAWTRGFLILGTLASFLFLIGTYSRTSLICAILAISFVLPLSYSLRRPRAGFIIALFATFLLLCGLFALVAFNLSFTDIIDFIEGEKTTLSGRANVWHIAYQAFLENQLLGTGYGSLWSAGHIPAEKYTDLPLTDFLLGLTQAHSGYFDTLATLGLVGIATFTIFMIGVVWIYLRATFSESGNNDTRLLSEFSGFVIVAALVYNLTETTFLSTDFLWGFYILCYISLCTIGYEDNKETTPNQEQTVCAGTA